MSKELGSLSYQEASSAWKFEGPESLNDRELGGAVNLKAHDVRWVKECNGM